MKEKIVPEKSSENECTDDKTESTKKTAEEKTPLIVSSDEPSEVSIHKIKLKKVDPAREKNDKTE